MIKFSFKRILTLGVALLMAGVSVAASSRDEFSVVALGNSITRHGPAPAVKWTGDWGMAASSASSDYVGQLERVLADHGRKPTSVKRYNVATLERTPGLKLDPSTSAQARRSHLLVIALGDNAKAGALRDFESNYQTLLAQVRPQRGVMLCLSTWWQSATVDALIKSACLRAQGLYVDIGDIHLRPGAKPAKHPGLDDPGVLNHPGDLGMTEIAARIASAYARSVQP